MFQLFGNVSYSLYTTNNNNNNSSSQARMEPEMDIFPEKKKKKKVEKVNWILFAFRFDDLIDRKTFLYLIFHFQNVFLQTVAPVITLEMPD